MALSLSSARSSSLSLPSNLLAAPTLRPPTSVQRLMLPLAIRHCKRPNNKVLILMQCKAADMTHAHEDMMVSYWIFYVLLGYQLKADVGKNGINELFVLLSSFFSFS